MKKEYKYRMVIGAIILLAAVALQMFYAAVDSRVISMVVIAGVVLVGTGVVRYMKYGTGPETDERTRKISAFALSYSWIVTLVLVCVLFLSDEFGILKLTVAQALGSVMSVMIAVPIILQWYFKRKGDAG
ncbi:MAG: hypothetical protein U9P44_04205 [archaeon]|nr:hypothetical protein [archaeon]